MIKLSRKIKKNIPGSLSKKLIERDKKNIVPAVSRYNEIGIKKAKGSLLEDMDGNFLIDFTAGIAVCNVGHSNPKVVEAIKHQSENLIHISQHVAYYEKNIELIEKLKNILPGELKNGRVFLGLTGSDAIDTAIKFARIYTRKQNIIAFLGGFHGRTFGALSLTASSIGFKKYQGPLLSGVFHVPYPYCYRCLFNQQYPDCKLSCINYLEFLLKTANPPEDTAAIVVEPIQGEGGYIVPPDDFLPELKKICEKYGILLILDEIQSGMGRTGKMFACNHSDVTPDILVIGKGLGGGMPISAVVSKKAIAEKIEKGLQGGTFCGHPVSCAAACAAIDVMVEEKLCQRAEKLGIYIQKRLYELQKKISIIGDIRGKGLMIGIELVKNKDTKEPAKEERRKVLNLALKKGLLLIGAGTYDNVIRIAPPLVIKKEEIDKGLNILEEVLKEITYVKN